MEKNNYNLSLARFMKKKSEWIEKNLGIKNYTTVKDQQWLVWTLDEHTAKLAWKQLERNIKRDGDGGMTSSVCVFCIIQDLRYEFCDDCFYGKRHGRCSYSFHLFRGIFNNASYSQVIKKYLKYLEEHDHEGLTNTIYRQMLKQSLVTE